MTFIKNAKIVTEDGIIWDGYLTIDNGKIVDFGNAIDAKEPENAEIIDAQGAYVGPGFVDIHVHGGAKSMFDTDPLGAAEHFLAHGETSVLATMYYQLSKQEFVEAVKRVNDVMKQDGAGKAIVGFYMEGPYMNPKFGASPQQNKWKGEIKEENYAEIVETAGKNAKVWAIAPEREGIEPFMAYARKVNPTVKFACGHSEASPADFEKVKKYGINILTHCMDATGRVPTWDGTRAAGPDEVCFITPDMYAELICDSQAIHVNRHNMKMMLQIKGLDKIILITDSFVSELPSPDELAYITDLSFDENKGLSGSKLTMDKVCKNFMQNTNCGIAQAFIAASANPAKAIGMYDEIGSIDIGKKANLVFVDDMFNVKQVMLEGNIINK